MSTKMITAYELTKQLNKALSEANVDQTVKPQMMYNYVKNNLIPADENKRISQETANLFIKKFVSKRVSK